MEMRFIGFSLGNGVVQAFSSVPSGEPPSPDGAGGGGGRRGELCVAVRGDGGGGGAPGIARDGEEDEGEYEGVCGKQDKEVVGGWWFWSGYGESERER